MHAIILATFLYPDCQIFYIQLCNHHHGLLDVSVKSNTTHHSSKQNLKKKFVNRACLSTFSHSYFFPGRGENSRNGRYSGQQATSQTHSIYKMLYNANTKCQPHQINSKFFLWVSGRNYFPGSNRFIKHQLKQKSIQTHAFLSLTKSVVSVLKD